MEKQETVIEQKEKKQAIVYCDQTFSKYISEFLEGDSLIKSKGPRFQAEVIVSSKILRPE